MNRLANQDSLAGNDSKFSFALIFQLLRRCWPFYKPQLKHLIAFSAFAFFMALVVLVPTLIGTDLIENKVLLGEPLEPLQSDLLFLDETYTAQVENETNTLSREQRVEVRDRLIFWGFFYVLLLIISVSVAWYYSIWIFQRINQDLRVHLLAKLERLSLRYHAMSQTGDSVYRVYQDTAAITRVLENLITTPLRIIFFLGFSTAILGAFSPSLVFLILFAAVPITILLKVYTPKIRVAARLSRELNSLLTSNIQETLSVIRVVKANGAEKEMMKRFQYGSTAALEAAYSLRKYMSILTIGVSTISVATVILAEYLIVGWALEGKATFLGAAVAVVGFAVWNLGAFKAAVARGEEAADSTRQLAEVWSTAQDTLIGLSRSFELLDSDVEVEDAKSPKPFPQSLDGVAFRNLVFSYSETKKVLSGINFSASPGSITAVVGGTGSGKSTLMSLLLRLYDPEEGSIEINGINIRDLSVTDLRNNIAIALQQNELFAMTVKENIVYGQSRISDIDIVEACRIACAHEFISALPRGYDTELGERGGKLSTGQKQRISIARAVVRSTPILILDEPTASLDAETERKVIENLARWVKERIVFIITHRLSTIRSADQIILIHEGNISESGTHDELMNNQGPYRDFVDAELGLRAKN